MPRTTLGDVFDDTQTALVRARDAEPSRCPALNAATAQLSRLTGTLCCTRPQSCLLSGWRGHDRG